MKYFHIKINMSFIIVTQDFFSIILYSFSFSFSVLLYNHIKFFFFMAGWHTFLFDYLISQT